jgi:23S rRNA (adenine2503-C2)-methyltransferase
MKPLQLAHPRSSDSAAPALVDYGLDELRSLLAQRGIAAVHAERLLRAFYRSGGCVDRESIELPQALWRMLGGELPLRRSRILRSTTAADGTRKLLVGMDGGGAVESVLMPGYRPDRAAGCVSSQVGCAMGCDFCASTRGGLERSLDAGEIVEQFLHLRAEALAMGRRLQTLVFMGMGEPMQNLDAVLSAVRRIADPKIGELGWRQVTISTVGIVEGIDRLAAADLNVNLAVSLHAPDDATRGRLVPTNRRWPVADILAATRRFADTTGRVPTIEYTLLEGVNDSDEQAMLLSKLLQGWKVHVNLIPYNPTGPGVSGATYVRPPKQRVERFKQILLTSGVVTHWRDTRGDDVMAACGQLRERS